MIKSTMVFQVACMQSAPTSAYLNSGSITTGRQFTLLLKSTKSSFIQKQFLLHKCYKRSFRLPSSSGHAYATSHTFISCSLKYPATDHWKAGTRASSCLSDNSWLSWKHRCQRKAPLSSHCSLDSEGGEAAQSSSLHTVKCGLQLLWCPACASVTPHVQETQTRAPSAAHQRNKTSELFSANSSSLLKVSAARWFLQLQLCASHPSPALWHLLPSWPQTALVGTGSFSKAQSGHYQSPVLGMTPTQSSKYKYLIEKFNLILQNTDTTLPNVAK